MQSKYVGILALSIALLGGCKKVNNQNDNSEAAVKEFYGSLAVVSDQKLWINAAKKLEEFYQQQNDLITTRHIAAFYGSQSDYAFWGNKQRQDFLQKISYLYNSPLVDSSELKKSDCISFAKEVLLAACSDDQDSNCPAFRARISSILSKGDGRGTWLGNELHDMGAKSNSIGVSPEIYNSTMKGIYFNVDTDGGFKSNEDHAQQGWLALQAGLRELAAKNHDVQQVKRPLCEENNGKVSKLCYYGIPLDDMIIGYRKNDEQTQVDSCNNGIRKLQKVPFFFGVAAGGEHTFIGSYGKVYEFHWDMNPDGKGIEATPFEKWAWTAGAILVPGQYWDSNDLEVTKCNPATDIKNSSGIWQPTQGTAPVNGGIPSVIDATVTPMQQPNMVLPSNNTAPLRAE